MTHQIVIKLNEEKFKPILDKLKSNGYGAVGSYSELAGKIIFFDYLLWNKKCDELENKTRMQFLMNKLDETHVDFMKFFLSQETEFISPGKFERRLNLKKCSGKSR